MPTLRNYQIFISHAWKYSDEYLRIVSFLNTAPYFLWTNLSVPKHDPLVDMDRLKQDLRNQMRDADVFIILGGMYVAYSDWIDFEINFARRTGRKILGVRPWASSVVPTAIQRGADKIVGWNTDSIVSAIRELAP